MMKKYKILQVGIITVTLFLVSRQILVYLAQNWGRAKGWFPGIRPAYLLHTTNHMTRDAKPAWWSFEVLGDAIRLSAFYRLHATSIL